MKPRTLIPIWRCPKCKRVFGNSRHAKSHDRLTDDCGGTAVAGWWVEQVAVHEAAVELATDSDGIIHNMVNVDDLFGALRVHYFEA